MIRRKSTSPQTQIHVLLERIQYLEREVVKLKQAGPSHLQADDHTNALDPFPWEVMLHHPGGHRPAIAEDTTVYWHPGKVDQVTGEVIDAGWKAIDGPVVQPVKIFADTEIGAIGDGAFFWMIPEDLDATKLIGVDGWVSLAGSSQMIVQVNNETRGIDMLTTRITIDATKRTSYASAVQPVVNTGGTLSNPNNKVYTGNILRFDIDGYASGSKGLGVHLKFH